MNFFFLIFLILTIILFCAVPAAAVGFATRVFSAAAAVAAVPP